MSPRDDAEFVEPTECPSCNGSCVYDVGDPEDGIQDICPQCEGSGYVEDVDVFVPERDAFTPND
jgi:DnaJ-class molecular chaperone